MNLTLVDRRAAGAAVTTVALTVTAGLLATRPVSARAPAGPHPGLPFTIFLPHVSRSQPPAPPTPLPPTPAAQACAAIPGAAYGELSVNGGPTNRPAAIHPDVNLTLRGWAPTAAERGLVWYGGETDERAPLLRGLLPGRLDGEVAFGSLHRVHDWLWSVDRRGQPLADWAVTLAGLPIAPAQTLHVPPAGYDLGQGFQVLVLYATPERITLKYTREDNVVYGYTLHLEGVCVEPGLLALYDRLDAAGRGRLPALRAGQAFGRARGEEVLVAVRDTGMFMDPRSGKDWW
jgi:hypothetical protein